MLSNVEILEVIKSKELVIRPFDKKQIRPAGITFRLGYTILELIPGKKVDIKKKEIPDYKKYRLRKNKPYLLKSGEFILGETLEKVTISNKLGFMMEGRSTLARLGITVVQTAMIVDTGIKNRAITLEIKNNGPNDVFLYPEMKIGRAIVFRLGKPASFEYDQRGKYRYQKGIGKPILEDEF